MSTILGRTSAFFFNALPTASQAWSFTAVRNRMRYHFPRPNERQRVVEQGYFKRLSTPSGRKILMRRILKGRHVLGH